MIRGRIKTEIMNGKSVKRGIEKIKKNETEQKENEGTEKTKEMK